MNQHDTEKLLDGLRALARQESALGAPPHVEAALLQALRRRKRAAAVRWALLSGAVAASLVAAAWLWPSRPPLSNANLSRDPEGAVVKSKAGQHTSRPTIAGGGIQPVPAPGPLRAKVAGPPRPIQEPAKPKTAIAAVRQASPRPAGRPGAPAPAAQTRFATEFLRVPGADPFEPLDRGRVLRVQLPRSAMEVFGLPVNESRWGERVQADVVLTEDGMVRAVRFVQ